MALAACTQRPVQARGSFEQGSAMLDAPWANPWFRRMGIAVSYGLLIYLVRQISITHFLLLTGVHLTVLLLTRYRDWPALVVGEMAALIPITIECLNQW